MIDKQSEYQGLYTEQDYWDTILDLEDEIDRGERRNIKNAIFSFILGVLLTALFLWVGLVGGA